MIRTPPKTSTGKKRGRPTTRIIPPEGEKQILFRIGPSKLGELDAIIAKRKIPTRNAWFVLIVDETIKESEAGKKGARRRRRIAKRSTPRRKKKARTIKKKKRVSSIAKRGIARRAARARPRPAAAKKVPIEHGEKREEKHGANGAQGKTDAIHATTA